SRIAVDFPPEKGRKDQIRASCAHSISRKRKPADCNVKSGPRFFLQYRRQRPCDKKNSKSKKSAEKSKGFCASNPPNTSRNTIGSGRMTDSRRLNRWAR